MNESKKTFGKRMAEFCLPVVKSWSMWLLAAVLCLFAFYQFATSGARDIALWKYMITLPEPEHCALCTDDGVVRTYPCLVKLETGQAGQIDVYDIGSEYLQGITQFQETGIFTTFSFIIDLAEFTTTEAHSSTSTLTIPKDSNYINPSLYCLNCRAKIAEVIDGAGITEVGYVLADMYDPEHIRIYPITDGAEYDIQGYTVKASKDKENKGLMVSVTGYFD